MIFLDDGGVMNDAQVRRAQWLPLVAGFFVPKLGGTPEAWKAANSQVMSRLQDERAWQARLRESRDYASFDRQYKIDWLRGMCELAGVPSPVDEDCVSLAQAAYKYIAPRKRAAFAGVAAAIRNLHKEGYTLHTASGESSEELDGYLQSMMYLYHQVQIL